MKAKTLHVFLLLGISFLLGCQIVDVTKTGKGFFEPTNPNEVEIIFTKPLAPYTELGSVSGSKFLPNSTATMHNLLRTKSAPLGANAVLILNQGVDPNGYVWVAGVAIRFNK